MLHAEQPVFKT